MAPVPPIILVGLTSVQRPPPSVFLAQEVAAIHMYVCGVTVHTVCMYVRMYVEFPVLELNTCKCGIEKQISIAGQQCCAVLCCAVLCKQSSACMLKGICFLNYVCT